MMPKPWVGYSATKRIGVKSMGRSYDKASRDFSWPYKFLSIARWVSGLSPLVEVHGLPISLHAAVDLYPRQTVRGVCPIHDR